MRFMSRKKIVSYMLIFCMLFSAFIRPGAKNPGRSERSGKKNSQRYAQNKIGKRRRHKLPHLPGSAYRFRQIYFPQINLIQFQQGEAYGRQVRYCAREIQEYPAGCSFALIAMIERDMNVQGLADAIGMSRVYTSALSFTVLLAYNLSSIRGKSSCVNV